MTKAFVPLMQKCRASYLGTTPDRASYFRFFFVTIMCPLFLTLVIVVESFPQIRKTCKHINSIMNIAVFNVALQKKEELEGFHLNAILLIFMNSVKGTKSFNLWHFLSSLNKSCILFHILNSLVYIFQF